MPQTGTPDGRQNVAVVGAGFSGLLTAIHLLRLNARLRVTLIERRKVFGPGTAYDTGNPHHLLNVRLDNMGAFPDQPGHLADWLAEQPSWRAQDGFITRGVYGDYLQHLLDQALDGAPERLTLAASEARALDRNGAGWTLTLDDGGTVQAEAVVLALGNLEPASPPGVDEALRNSPLYVENPWRLEAEAAEGARDILLIGAGLTMVDAALSLRRPGRRFTALSRHGLLPRAHATVPPEPYVEAFAGGPSDVLKQVRQATQTHDWRAVFDHLRHSARPLWRSWTAVQRKRFLRHLRPLWDVHRHRLSPGSARDIHSMLASGELTVLAGKLSETTLDGRSVEAAWRPRGRRRAIRGRFDLVVNCTGPLGVIQQSREPLIADILKKGYGRPDPLGLGLQVDGDGRLIGQDRPTDGLYAIGPLTRGAFWEITAVPDLRAQALDLAEHVADAAGATGQSSAADWPRTDPAAIVRGT